MRRVLGLMLFCFGIGMTLLLFIPETLSTLIFIIGCLTLGLLSFLRMRSIQKIAEVCEIRDFTENTETKKRTCQTTCPQHQFQLCSFN